VNPIEFANFLIPLNGLECPAGNVNRHSKFSLENAKSASMVTMVVRNKQCIDVANVSIVVGEP
jgi:hypothetical protein